MSYRDRLTDDQCEILRDDVEATISFGDSDGPDGAAFIYDLPSPVTVQWPATAVTIPAGVYVRTVTGNAVAGWVAGSMAVALQDLHITCAWFALCPNPATRLEPNRMLGPVPICQRCTDKLASL